METDVVIGAGHREQTGRQVPGCGMPPRAARHTGLVRIILWVGLAHSGVGGDHNGALVIRVSVRAVGGQATEAALAAASVSAATR